MLLNKSQPAYCPQCGGRALHYDCYNLCDEGYFDLYEENPNEYTPGAEGRCDVCYGQGGWTVCPDCGYDSLAKFEKAWKA